jgi:copper chaperone
MKLIVDGMTCEHCERTITKAIHGLDADATVVVDIAAGVVNIEGGVNAGLAAAAVESEGYRVVSVQDAPKSCCGSCHA